MTKTLTISGLAIAAILVVLVFVTATSYTQLAIAVVLYPALAYLALIVFPRRKANAPAIMIQVPSSKLQKVGESKKGTEIADMDKRSFLKLVGAVGVSVFVFSLLGQRASDLIFKRNSVVTTPPNPDEAGGSGAQGPLAGYKVAELDEGDTSYYGFANKDGAWLIMKQDSETNSFRYVRGSINFPSNWASRQNLKYDYFYNLF